MLKWKHDAYTDSVSSSLVTGAQLTHHQVTSSYYGQQWNEDWYQAARDQQELQHNSGLSSLLSQPAGCNDTDAA